MNKIEPTEEELFNRHLAQVEMKLHSKTKQELIAICLQAEISLNTYHKEITELSTKINQLQASYDYARGNARARENSSR